MSVTSVCADDESYCIDLITQRLQARRRGAPPLPAAAPAARRATITTRYDSSRAIEKLYFTLALCNLVRDPVRETPAFLLRNIIVKIKSYRKALLMYHNLVKVLIVSENVHCR